MQHLPQPEEEKEEGAAASWIWNSGLSKPWSFGSLPDSAPLLRTEWPHPTLLRHPHSVPGFKSALTVPLSLTSILEDLYWCRGTFVWNFPSRKIKPYTFGQNDHKLQSSTTAKISWGWVQIFPFSQSQNVKSHMNLKVTSTIIMVRAPTPKS